MAFNVLTFFETSSKFRGGKSVWVKDGNGENRANVLSGCTIANPNKGMGHLWAAQLFQYTPFQSGYIFRSFAMQAQAAADATTIYVKGDGYSDFPEVGMLLMKAPASLTIDHYATSPATGVKQKVKVTFTAGCSSDGNVTIGLDGTETTVAVTTAATTAAAVAALVGAANFPNYTVSYTADNAYVEFEANTYGEKAYPSLAVASTGVTGTIEETIAGVSDIVKSTSNYTGQSAKVTAVSYDETAQKFTVTLDTALGVLLSTDILVEAAGESASSTASVLVSNPNTFIESDIDTLPTDGSYGLSNVNISISPIYDKKAWIQRMQPLPAYILAKNRSLIDGIYWI